MRHWLEKKRQQLEEFKYRNVDVSDPDVQRRIRESEEGIKQDIQDANMRVYIAIILAIFLILWAYFTQT